MRFRSRKPSSVLCAPALPRPCGEARGRVGNVVPGIYPTDTLQCDPGGHNDYIMIMAIVVSPHMWDGVLRTIGREDLIGHPQWGDPQWRDAHRDEVKALIEGWTTRLRLPPCSAMTMPTSTANWDLTRHS